MISLTYFKYTADPGKQNSSFSLLMSNEMKSGIEDLVRASQKVYWV